MGTGIWVLMYGHGHYHVGGTMWPCSATVYPLFRECSCRHRRHVALRLQPLEIFFVPCDSGKKQLCSSFKGKYINYPRKKEGTDGRLSIVKP